MAQVRVVDKEDDQKTDGRTVYRQMLISAKLKTGKTGITIELTRRITLTF
jgi:hypothetical protein